MIGQPTSLGNLHSHSLLVREINWLETTQQSQKENHRPEQTPYSLGKLIDWKRRNFLIVNLGASVSLLVREINWLETDIKSIKKAITIFSLLVREINWLETVNETLSLIDSWFRRSLLVREINWLETTNRKLMLLLTFEFSLLVREINWLETYH